MAGMAIFPFSGRRFWIGAVRCYDEVGRPEGWLPEFAEPPPAAAGSGGSAHPGNWTRFLIPGRYFDSEAEAVERARAFVVLNEEAHRAARRPRPGDVVVHLASGRRGLVLPSQGSTFGRVPVRFDPSGTAEVNLNELYFVPH
jgi:hypothetical protein